MSHHIFSANRIYLKHNLLIFLLVIIKLNGVSQGVEQIDKPKIYIITNQGQNLDSEDRKTCNHLLRIFSTELKKFLPCASILNENDVSIYISILRQQTLLGANTEGSLEAIFKEMNADYVIVFSINKANDYFLNASVLATNSANRVSSRMCQTSLQNSVMETLKLASEIGKNLSAMEFCPFKGQIDINIINSKDEVHERDNRCGVNNSGHFRHTDNYNYRWEETWMFEKKTRVQARGNCEIAVNETKSEREVMSGCKHCPLFEGDSQVGTDPKGTNEDKTVVYEFKSGAKGLKIDRENPHRFPAKVILTFDTLAKTYMIQVLAVSDIGTFSETTTHKILNSCNEKAPDDLENKGKRIYSIRQIFGPFKGTPWDKTLSENYEENEDSIISGGKVTYKKAVKFSFSR